ncbi:MAG: tetratricopeptide repeat protein [Chitinispirillaceae bacterium]|nr:tetratricopeptide repeat protein [Chitinispirillaceae bacterium]
MAMRSRKKTVVPAPITQNGEKAGVFSLGTRDVLFGLFLVFLTFAAYYPALNGTPIWDDDANITKQELRSINGLVRIWTEIGATQQYYPLLHTVFWLQHRLWGDNPLGYHLCNILLHIFSALLLFRILRFLRIPGGWMAPAIWMLHPVQVESVAWITELKNTFSGVFFMLAAFVYLHFDKNRKTKLYLLALACFTCGLLSKPVVAVLPLVLLSIFWWKRERILFQKDFLPLLPFFIIGMTSGLLIAWVERTYVQAQGEEFNFSFVERLLIASRAFWFYLSSLFFPVNLSFIYPQWNISAAKFYQYLFLLAGCALGFFTWFLRKHYRAPFATLVYYAATLFPALGFVNLYFFRYSFVADHFQYLASIGPIVLLVAVVYYLCGRYNKSKVIPAIFGIILAVLSGLTWKQSSMYSDIETLYKVTLKKNPACWMATYNLGSHLASQGRTNEAEEFYRKTIAIHPTHAKANNNLGVILAKAGRPGEAFPYLQSALSIDPDNTETLVNMGNVLVQTGRSSDAIAYFQKAMQLNPSIPDARGGLAYALAVSGKTDEAVNEYHRLLEAHPGDPNVLYNLGMVLMKAGRPGDALAYFQDLERHSPHSIPALNLCASALMQANRECESVPYYQRIAVLDPGNVPNRRNLAAALSRCGRWDEAVKTLEAARTSAEIARQEEIAAAIRGDIAQLKKKIPLTMQR